MIRRLRVALPIALQIASLPLLLRTAGVRRTARWTGGSRMRPRQDADRMALGVRLTDKLLAGIPARFRPACLVRTLILHRLARRSGFDVHLHLGVCREAGELKGHAWVCEQGRALYEIEDPVATYRITWSHPSLDGSAGAGVSSTSCPKANRGPRSNIPSPDGASVTSRSSVRSVGVEWESSTRPARSR